MKEIPADIIKQIEDEANRLFPQDMLIENEAKPSTRGLNDNNWNKSNGFFNGAIFGYSLSPSSGEGDLAASNKALSEVPCDAPFDSSNSIEQIRKEYGAYIWVFPIKWRDENGKTYKESFGFEIEQENGKCFSYGYSGEQEIPTYEKAELAAVITFHGHQPFSFDRKELEKVHEEIKNVLDSQIIDTTKLHQKFKNKQPTEPGQGVKTAEEVLKEVACDFFWECRLDIQKNGYQEVRKMYDSWFDENKYHKNKMEQYRNQDGWISVEDRLPEVESIDHATEVIAYTGKKPGATSVCSVFWNGKFYVASTWGEYSAGAGGDEITLVSHWRELDEPNI